MRPSSLRIGDEGRKGCGSRYGTYDEWDERRICFLLSRYLLIFPNNPHLFMLRAYRCRANAPAARTGKKYFPPKPPIS